ncbi:MAG TPA: DUF4382 domain-containing protein [bacterium (Candidatus Stahlbacteria)]|nr:DUF4382 domain-containing protein [Candidatus Stahlbacteria bacterium]
MKSVSLFLIVLALIAGCAKGPIWEGKIRVEVFDTPPPADVEHIYIKITEVSVQSPTAGWKTVAKPNITYDFLELINGTTAVLADTSLTPGYYTQMRLTVSDTNEVVVGGESYPLVVPSGVETGIKLNLDFDIGEGELIEILIDFNASKSIIWTPGIYLLRPTFRAFKKILSGTISGSVKDTTGMGIPNALVKAISLNDTVSTITNSTGSYKLILPAGIYDIGASAEDYTVADTMYIGVEVQAGKDLINYDFVLE